MFKSSLRLCHGETVDMMADRWGKLYKDFKKSANEFDLSKIPDIYDCIKYDRAHNSRVFTSKRQGG